VVARSASAINSGWFCFRLITRSQPILSISSTNGACGPSGKRPIMPGRYALVPVLAVDSSLLAGPKLEQQRLQISARSIEQRLRPYKRKQRQRLYGGNKPGTLLKHNPGKTERWHVQVPGFAKIDLVSHSGNSASGDFCYWLNLTNMHAGWTKTGSVLGKNQEAVRAALKVTRSDSSAYHSDGE
jgi:hypothetical protein